MASPLGWASPGRSLPVALIGIGIGLVMGGKDDDTDSDLDRLARVAVGSLATLIAATGLLHVFRGRPGLDDPIAEGRRRRRCPRDGRRGVLHALADSAGAAVILLAVGVIGVIIVTGSSARTVGEFVAKSARMIPALFGRAFRVSSMIRPRANRPPIGAPSRNARART